MTCMNKYEQKPTSQQTLVEKHALNRLNKVEKEKRKPYVKTDSGISFQKIFIFFVFIIVLLVMLIGII